MASFVRAIDEAQWSAASRGECFEYSRERFRLVLMEHVTRIFDGVL